MGTINMLGLAKRVKAKMLLTSTSEIYGDPKVHPQPESYWGNVNTIGPRACYDEGKRVAETMMYSYKNQNDVDVRVARIFVSITLICLNGVQFCVASRYFCLLTRAYDLNT